MNGADQNSAWLEQPSGERIPINGTCSLGRLSSNTIVIPDERVSRRHAMINAQGAQEFWLVDLGSGNGTSLNGRRVVQPTLLKQGDEIEIAGLRLVFHQPRPDNSPVFAPLTGEGVDTKTIHQFTSMQCWLLVADIEDSTRLMRKDSEPALSIVTGRWLSECKQLVEDCDGSINKFLGDGFFAYWRQAPDSSRRLVEVLQKLREMQKAQDPPFRVVLHFGEVFAGGPGSLGEENLQGKEVYFVFRMEKLAGSLGESCLISEAARAALAGRLELVDVGRHSVKGFDGDHSFHALAK